MSPTNVLRWSAWRRIVILGMVMTLAAALALVAGPPGRAAAASTLLSQGQPATASSTENAAYPASDAVDGNTGTRWSSAFSDPQWLQVDLGATATITQVVAALGGGVRHGVPDPDLDRRHDLDHDLLHHHRHRRHADPQRDRHRPVRPDVRHRARHPVRLLAVGVPGLRQPGQRRHLRHHERGAEPARHRLLDRERRHSRRRDAVDGNTGTRWSSAFSDPQWLQVDLGSSADHLPGRR